MFHYWIMLLWICVFDDIGQRVGPSSARLNSISVSVFGWKLEETVCWLVWSFFGRIGNTASFRSLCRLTWVVALLWQCNVFSADAHVQWRCGAPEAVGIHMRNCNEFSQMFGSTNLPSAFKHCVQSLDEMMLFWRRRVVRGLVTYWFDLDMLICLFTLDFCSLTKKKTNNMSISERSLIVQYFFPQTWLKRFYMLQGRVRAALNLGPLHSLSGPVNYAVLTGRLGFRIKLKSPWDSLLSAQRRLDKKWCHIYHVRRVEGETL